MTDIILCQNSFTSSESAEVILKVGWKWIISFAKTEDPHQRYKTFSTAVDAAISSDIIQYKNAAVVVLIRAQFGTGDNFARRGHYGSSVATVQNAQDVLFAIQF